MGFRTFRLAIPLIFTLGSYIVPVATEEQLDHYSPTSHTYLLRNRLFWENAFNITYEDYENPEHSFNVSAFPEETEFELTATTDEGRLAGLIYARNHCLVSPNTTLEDQAPQLGEKARCLERGW